MLKKLEEFVEKVEELRQKQRKCITKSCIKMRQNDNISIDLLPEMVYNESNLLLMQRSGKEKTFSSIIRKKKGSEVFERKV